MYMHIYCNNPTEGGTDGTQISEGTGLLSPLTIGPLNATENEESAAIKLAVRCETGYQTGAETIVTPTGATKIMWALALDNGGVPGTFGAYGAALTLPSGITATNTLFWVKAKSVNTESPANDTTVSLYTTCAAIVTTS